ncbi:MAG: cupin domain-containing protein [Nannocystaceae bacterium]|nr:cupin domain-containing protein [Nannocystaceae bacterium]
MNAPASFERLRAPTVTELLAQHFGRHVVHWRAAEVLPAAGVLARWDAREALDAVDAASIDADGRQHQGPIVPAAIDEALAHGRTVCAQCSAWPELAPLLAELGAWVPSLLEPAFGKLYASPPGSGFALHMDAHHVLVLQLRGRKRWRVGDAVVAAPLAGGKLEHGRAVHTFPREGDPILGDDGEPIAAPEPSSLRELVLEPGDCLYVPPGAWHGTVALEDSVAVSLSPPRAPALRMVLAVLEQELAMRPHWRADLVRGNAGAGAVPAAVAEALARCARELGALVREVDEVLLQRAWGMAAVAGAIGPGAQPRPVRRHHLLAHADGPGFVVVADPRMHEGVPGRIHVLFAGGELELPSSAQRWLDQLAANPRFRADAVLQWDPGLQWDQARELLSQLLEVGLLIDLGDAGA